MEMPYNRELGKQRYVYREESYKAVIINPDCPSKSPGEGLKDVLMSELLPHQQIQPIILGSGARGVQVTARTENCCCKFSQQAMLSIYTAFETDC